MAGGNFFNHVSFKIGGGDRIHFWHDFWCGDLAVKNFFLSLFKIARLQDAAMEDLFSFVNDSIQWNVDFIKNLQDWEVNDVSDFFGRLYDL